MPAATIALQGQVLLLDRKLVLIGASAQALRREPRNTRKTRKMKPSLTLSFFVSFVYFVVPLFHFLSFSSFSFDLGIDPGRQFLAGESGNQVVGADFGHGVPSANRGAGDVRGDHDVRQLE